MVIKTGKDAAVRGALQRVLESKHFAQAAGLSNMLRYVVEETLAGRGLELKEYNIGCEVFGRGETFDPKIDGIVRVQAHRLRGKLKDYYAAEGNQDEIVISVPAGGYAAEFGPNVKSPLPRPSFPWRWVAAATAVAVVIGAGI